MADGSEYLTFIVRLRIDEEGRTAVVERVTTGEKVRLLDLGALGPTIERLMGPRAPRSAAMAET